MIQRTADAGRHIILRLDGVEHRLWAPPELSSGDPFAAVVPLDATGPERSEATLRFWRHVLDQSRPGRPASPAALTVERARAALYAFDLKREGASYRDISHALFGPVPDRAAESRRDCAIRLVRAARARVARDYLRLLCRKGAP